MKQFIIYYFDDIHEECEYWVQANKEIEALDRFFDVSDADELDYPLSEIIRIDEAKETFEERLQRA